MGWRALSIIGVMAAMVAPQAYACSPVQLAEPLPGESGDDFYNRYTILAREREATLLRERETHALAQATMIFVARTAQWPSPSRSRLRDRPVEEPFGPSGRQPPTYTKHFTPIAWLRGPRPRLRFGVPIDLSSCGYDGVGETAFAEPGDLLIFFATSSRLSRQSLIDAIPVEQVTDPALLAFVARLQR